MRVWNAIREVIYRDAYVSARKAEEEARNQRGIALIACAAFLVMSLLNIMQKSYIMLVTTAGSAVFLLIGYFMSKYRHNGLFLRMVYYVIFIVVFTAYTLKGGNDGFAALWLVIATYAVMSTIDFKMGFIISCYYLLMLLLLFVGPLQHLLQFAYNPTFLLRFPFFYGTNFVFATYIVISSRGYQYQLIIKQQELERLSMVDLSTGLMNRNYFIQCSPGFVSDPAVKSLLAVFIDVNGLHEINNRDGHAAGDSMLRYIADTCRRHFPQDGVYRMGGDEFLIICKNTDLPEVEIRIDQLLQAIDEAGYSISYGIAMQEKDYDITSLITDADERMIAYKKAYYAQHNKTKR